MGGPYDRAGNFWADFVLDHHLPPDQCRSAAYRACGFSIRSRQIEDDPFAVTVDTIADDRCVRVGHLIAPANHQSVVSCGLRTVIPPPRPGLAVDAVIEITGQVIIV